MKEWKTPTRNLKEETWEKKKTLEKKTSPVTTY